MTTTPRRESPSTTRTLFLRALQLKDPWAWEEFWSRYRGLVRRIAARHGLGKHDLDDVSQEVFLRVSKAVERLERRRHRGAFRGWLARLAEWITRDHLRRERRQFARIEAMPRVPDEASPEFTNVGTASLALEQSELAALAHMALSRLQRKFRPITLQMFGLHVIDGKDAATVARFLGVTTSRVYVAKLRVLPYLRRELSRMQGAIQAKPWNAGAGG